MFTLTTAPVAQSLALARISSPSMCVFRKRFLSTEGLFSVKISSKSIRFLFENYQTSGHGCITHDRYSTHTSIPNLKTRPSIHTPGLLPSARRAPANLTPGTQTSPTPLTTAHYEVPATRADRLNGLTQLPGTRHDDPQRRTRRPSIAPRLRPPSSHRFLSSSPLLTFIIIR